MILPETYSSNYVKGNNGKIQICRFSKKWELDIFLDQGFKLEMTSHHLFVLGQTLMTWGRESLEAEIKESKE